MEGIVLIVDDEPEILETLRRCLVLAGLPVETCSDPEEALARVRVKGYPVMLSDIMMPGMSGIELLRQVRSRQPLCNVIMMTAFTSMDKVVECLSAGAVDYLVKPFDDLDAVVARIREAMARVERWRQTIAPV